MPAGGLVPAATADTAAPESAGEDDCGDDAADDLAATEEPSSDVSSLCGSMDSTDDDVEEAAGVGSPIPGGAFHSAVPGVPAGFTGEPARRFFAVQASIFDYTVGFEISFTM